MVFDAIVWSGLFKKKKKVKNFDAILSKARQVTCNRYIIYYIITILKISLTLVVCTLQSLQQ